MLTYGGVANYRWKENYTSTGGKKSSNLQTFIYARRPSTSTFVAVRRQGPDLIRITFERLHESLGNQGPHSMHEDGDQHSAIQQEESVDQFQPTKQELQEELNKQFATTIQLLEERREPQGQSAVDVLCQTDPRADSSDRVFQDAKSVREAMDIFDQITHKCSHVTQYCQTGSRIRYVCQSVCASLTICRNNKGTCVFTASTMVESHKGKCGLHDTCCCKVIFSKERKNNGKQSGGNQFSVAMDSSIFDHSITYSALGAVHRPNNLLNLWCTILHWQTAC
jgi:hypothetical protein